MENKSLMRLKDRYFKALTQKNLRYGCKGINLKGIRKSKKVREFLITHNLIESPQNFVYFKE